MARKITVSSIGGSLPAYPAEAPLPPAHDERLATEMVEHWRRRLEAVLPDTPDLIILPECSARYRFSPTFPKDEVVRLRSILGERVEAFLREVARENRCYIIFPSVFPAGDNLWFNGIRVFDRDGNCAGQYEKNFTVVTERATGILCGDKPTLIRCDFGTLAPIICFDLNFEELLAAYRELRPDLLVFSSMYHGGLMQAYWAYRCQAHFASSMGMDTLKSQIYLPTGTLLASSTNYHHHVTAQINLDCALVHLDFHWEKLLALKKKYGAAATITDPGELGAVLISCESNDLKVDQLLEEFQIERLSDYLNRSRQHRATPGNRLSTL